MKINSRILIPNLFSLMLVIGSLLLVIYQLKTESRVFEQEAQRTAQANQLTLNLHILHKRQSNNLLNYSFTRDKMKPLQGVLIQQQILRGIDQLKELAREVRASRMLDRYIQAYQGNIQIGRDLIEAIDVDDREGKKSAFLRWEIKGRLINATLSDLTSFYRRSLDRALSHSKKQIDNLIQLILAVLAASVLISGMSLSYYRRTIVSPIIHFKDAVDRISDGYFDVKVDDKVVQAGGEIGSLAIAVNRLGRDLHYTTVSRNVLAEEIRTREKMQIHLERTNKELDDFAHIVSHDLKAPLRGIRSLADIICEDYEDVLDDEGKECLELMKMRAERMHNMIVGIMEYSLFGRTEMKKEYIPMDSLAHEVVESLAPPDNIHINIQENLNTVFGNRVQVVQVFQNLFSNAIKYMDKENGTINLGCQDKGDHYQYFVQDNGPGISQEYFDKIFTIFQTLNARDDIESTGIGLSIIKKIVELHGGTTWLESILGQGSTFFVTFPKHNLGGSGDEFE